MQGPIYYINIISDFYGIGFCIIGLIIVFVWGSIIGNIRASTAIAFGMNITAIGANLVYVFLQGNTSPYALPILFVARYVEFSAWYFMAFAFAQYIIDRLNSVGSGTRLKWAVWGYIILVTLLLDVAQFNGMYYYFDADNIMHRGVLYPMSQVLSLTVLVISAALILSHRKKFPRAEVFVYLLVFALSFTAITLQIFIDNIPFISMALTFAMIVLFVMILFMQVRSKTKSEKSLAAIQLLLAESQIQPHFLYNSLVAIKQLCKENPQSAADAIDDFSSYLRGNMDALSCDHCIPIETEISHVEHYFALEKRRFGAKVNLVFELDSVSFDVPPLTVQPLVENAVKYGVLQKTDGVRVTVKTYSDQTGSYVIISDNGNGFDTEAYKTDGKKHLGLSMVGERLKTMARGTLDVKSTIGEGSVITVFVPKKQGTAVMP
ncbi:MAG: histidine kinase [Clostridiales bacterium]|nr:histidine kinase [Clostridiales bacterium]